MRIYILAVEMTVHLDEGLCVCALCSVTQRMRASDLHTFLLTHAKLDRWVKLSSMWFRRFELRK